MKNKMVFLVDDEINIIYNDRLINYRLKNIVSKGIVINKERFMEEYLKIINKEKIKNKLFGDSIIIIKNSFYNNRDIFYIENIFLELGYLKVLFKDIRELFLEDNATYIEINKDYMVINLDEGIFLDLKFFKDIPKILDYFSLSFSENIILFGRNKIIPKIEFKCGNLYFLENYQTFIVDSLLKINKYDV